MNNKQKGLTREDIHLYQTTKNERVKHSIEEKSLESDFDADALEGWTDSGLSVYKMKSAQEVFKGEPKSSNFKIYALSLVGIILTHLFFTYTVFVNPTIEPDDRQIVKIEKTDVSMPKEITAMDQLPEQALIQPVLVKKDFKKNKTQEIENKKAESTQQSVPETPIVLAPQDKENAVKITDASNLSTKVAGKEIYLVDFKLLDYRSYRSRPSVTTEQAVLTGTPASESGYEGKSESDFEWKTVEVPYIDYLEKTMIQFSKGSNKKALVRFEEILKSYPDDINALFYGGLCYYNLGEFEKAIASFQLCRDSRYNNFAEEAEWYMAKTYHAKKDLGKALELYQKIANSGGYYSSIAKSVLKNIK